MRARACFCMARKRVSKPGTLGPNSIRQWREYRNLTLERLADRVRELGEPITATSLSRIERQIQPYSQRVLEKLADALACEPSDLVMRRPPSQTQVELLSVIQGLTPDRQQQVLNVVKALVA